VPHTQYRTAKRKALEFSVLSDLEAILDHEAIGVCVVCGHILHDNDGPQTHHGIVTKGDGIHLNVWWNLFPVCDDTCHRTLEERNTWERVLHIHYIHISAWKLHDFRPTEQRGYDWLREQIEALDLHQQIELPLPKEVMATTTTPNGLTLSTQGETE
jgi:hypothetical protein